MHRYYQISASSGGSGAIHERLDCLKAKVFFWKKSEAGTELTALRIADFVMMHGLSTAIGFRTDFPICL